MKASLPRLTAWASASSCRTCPAALISATAMRIDDVPMSITATCRAGGVGGEISVSAVRLDIGLVGSLAHAGLHRLGPSGGAAGDGIISQFSCGDLERL